MKHDTSPRDNRFGSAEKAQEFKTAFEDAADKNEKTLGLSADADKLADEVTTDTRMTLKLLCASWKCFGVWGPHSKLALSFYDFFWFIQQLEKKTTVEDK